jgi:hypothetical protein
MHRVHSGMSPHDVRVLFRKQKYKLKYNISPKSYGVYPFFLPTCCWSLRFRSCAMSDSGWDGYMAPEREPMDGNQQHTYCSRRNVGPDESSLSAVSSRLATYLHTQWGWEGIWRFALTEGLESQADRL